MMNNKEILEEFGKIVIGDCFDPTLENMNSLREHSAPPEIYKSYAELFKSLNDTDFKLLNKYFKENLGGLIFNILRIFEENPQFRLLYEKNGQQVDLAQISEMLSAEPIIENGWISKFSKSNIDNFDTKE